MTLRHVTGLEQLIASIFQSGVGFSVLPGADDPSYDQSQLSPAILTRGEEVI